MAVIGEMRQLTIGGKTYTIPTYSLPIASSSVLGGIKVGSGLSIDPSTGTLTATGTSITIDTAMSDSSTNAVQNKVIKSYADGLIAALDGGTIGTPGAGKTLTALSQTNGQVSATFSNISITKSQVSDFPTKVSAFTNDSGYITSYTDEKLKWTASTSSNTYYPLQSTSTATTSTANTLNSVSFYQYYNTAGGYRRFILGNTTAYTSTGGAYGTIRLYGTGATYYGDLNPGTIGANSLTANRTWTLPNATGTIALTADIPTVPTNVSAFTNDAGYLTSYTETDPTVPSWAKASSKPSYTASEVGAAASDHVHGNITNGGDITATAPTIANGDQIVINDASASKITNGPTFDGSTTTKALTPKGTWETFLKSYTESDPVFSASAAAGITSSDITNWNGKTSNTGTVTKVTAGTGLKIGTASSGGDITTSGTINHINSVTAQTTQAVYPIKIDAQGHISAYGSAVTIVNTRGTATSGGTTLSVVNTGDMYTWNNKSDTDEKVKQESLNGTNSGRNILLTPSLGTTGTITNSVAYARYMTYNDYSQELSIQNSSDSTKKTTISGISISIKDGTYSTAIRANTPSAYRNIYLPDKNGTFALTSDIPSNVSSFTNDAGYISSTTTAKIFVQSATPTGMSAGDIWIDTTGL